jgi:hypothetical protein
MARKSRRGEVIITLSIPENIYQRLEELAKKERRKYPSWQAEWLLCQFLTTNSIDTSPEPLPVVEHTLFKKKII